MLLVALTGAGTVVGQSTATDRQVTTGISDTLEQERYAALAVRSVQTGFAVPGIDGSERHVPLILSRPVGTTYPALAGDLATNIEQRFDQPVSVSVTYRDQQQADSNRSADV